MKRDVRESGGAGPALAGRRPRRSPLVFLAATALLAGCVDELAPEVGPPLRERCDDADGDPAVTVSYAVDVAAIFQSRCFSCHTPGGRSPVGVEVGGLDLSTYAQLRAGGAVSAANIVVPGQPCASALLLKVLPAPPFGARMPLSGPPFLDEGQIRQLHDWVAEGAREN